MDASLQQKELRSAMTCASASFTEDLSCPICFFIFSDPVCLPCGHSFCRRCVRNALKSKAQCPHCQAAVLTKEKHLPTNFILRSLAEKAAAGEQQRSTAIPESLCPEHEEKLKLFCETDQQLACVICRDGKRHDGHKFKPIREAAESLRQQLEEAARTLSYDICAVEDTASIQKEDILKALNKSCHLKSLLRTQFEEMHQFLRKREEEINSKLEEKEREAVEKMNKRLKVIDRGLAERREVEARVRSALEISDPQGFLQRWSDGGNITTTEDLCSSRAEGFQVASESFSLGPYESHLQFFVWKEMLQVVQPLPERLSLRADNSNIRVSQDGRSLLCFPQSHSEGWAHEGYWHDVCKYFTLSTKQFSSGQHYWETEVGQRDFWELGIENNRLRYQCQKYEFIFNGCSEEIPYAGRPLKVGVYLNCSSMELSFYNADSMEHIHTITVPSYPLSLPQAAYFNIKYSPNPLSVCWY